MAVMGILRVWAAAVSATAVLGGCLAVVAWGWLGW